MTVINEREIVIPDYFAALLRERVAVERVINAEREALAAAVGDDRSSPRTDEYGRLRERQAEAALDVALMVRLMLDRLDAEGRPA